MAISNHQRALTAELRKTLPEINDVIDGVYWECSKGGLPAHRLKNPDGTLVLAPLLLARAQCLNALAILEANT